jgi:lipoyl-dependent peroxiredoxin
MAKRTADARWDGTLMGGSGQMKHGGGAYSGQYSFESRFGEGEGANPEELIGAAHAGCFSMNLSGTLEKEGHTPESIRTGADVHLTPKDGGGYEISRIELHTRVRVPGVDAEELQRIAEEAERTCPVSVALGGVREITVDAELEG